MIRARVECIGSRAEIGARYATVGLRAATDFRPVFGTLEEAKAQFQEELGRLEGVGQAGGGALASLRPPAALPNS